MRLWRSFTIGGKKNLLHTFIKTNMTHNSSVRSDEELMLETPAFQIFHDGISTFVNSSV